MCPRPTDHGTASACETPPGAGRHESQPNGHISPTRQPFHRKLGTRRTVATRSRGPCPGRLLLLPSGSAHGSWSRTAGLSSPPPCRQVYATPADRIAAQQPYAATADAHRGRGIAKQGPARRSGAARPGRIQAGGGPSRHKQRTSHGRRGSHRPARRRRLPERR
jgi:hypothetical protein